jgi:hypothetical protein
MSTVCQVLHKSPTPPHTKFSSPSTLIQHQTTNSSHHARLQDAYPLRYQDQQTGSHSRTFSITPIHHKDFMDPFASFSPSDTPELVTPEGLRSINEYTAARPRTLSARLQTSSENPHAHTFNLLFTPKNLMTMTLLTNSSWGTQVAAALEIVRREQRIALVRAGIPVSLCFLFST